MVQIHSPRPFPPFGRLRHPISPHRGSPASCNLTGAALCIPPDRAAPAITTHGSILSMAGFEIRASLALSWGRGCTSGPCKSSRRREQTEAGAGQKIDH